MCHIYSWSEMKNVPGIDPFFNIIWFSEMEQKVFSQVQQFVDGKEYHSMSTAFCVSKSTSALFLLSPSFSVFAPPRSLFPLSNTHVFFNCILYLL